MAFVPPQSAARTDRVRQNGHPIPIEHADPVSRSRTKHKSVGSRLSGPTISQVIQGILSGARWLDLDAGEAPDLR